MIPRYTRKEMGDLWSERAKFQAWLDIEILACEAQSKLGIVPPAAVKVIRQLAQTLAALPEGPAAVAVRREVDYLREHQARMDYRAARRAGEPIGSGPVEATCRQAQCRFKRPGQFWSLAGDEALLSLEMFWRNDRWSLLFPHTAFDPARN